LIPRLRELFDLSYFQAGLVQFAFFGAYFVLSIPAGFILSKIGYKRGIILGLLTMATGCLLFYPAASFRMFGIFMLAYFILAGGMTILQVAANPFVAVLGDESGASSRLNFSQAFNSLGTAIAPAVGALFILSDKIKSKEEIAALTDTARESYLASEAAAVQMPFLGLAAFIGIITLIFVFAKLPKIMEGNLVNYFLDMNMVPLIRESPTMMNIANFVSTIFFKSLEGADDKALLGIFVICYWSGAMIGRFIGSFLTRIIRPGIVLSLFAALAISSIIVSITTTGYVSMWSILAVGLFNSIMFPTIFTLAIDGMGELKPNASGLLCTAIVGGAIIPPLYGFMTDNVGFKMALLLVIACYAYILFYGWTKRHVDAAV